MTWCCNMSLKKAFNVQTSELFTRYLKTTIWMWSKVALLYAHWPSDIINVLVPRAFRKFCLTMIEGCLELYKTWMFSCLYPMSVCVCDRICVCVCVCVWEYEWVKSTLGIWSMHKCKFSHQISANNSPPALLFEKICLFVLFTSSIWRQI